MIASPATSLLASPRVTATIAWSCLALLVAGATVGVIVPAGMERDFANFYDAGHKALTGQIADLYDSHSLIAGREPLGNMLFLAPPLSSFLYAPLARLSPPTALVLFKLQNTAAIFLALVLLYRHTRNFIEPTTRARSAFLALFALAALLYQPFWTIYRTGGQTTPTVLLLLTVALLAYTSAHFGLAAVCFAVAILIKPVVGTGLVFLALLSGWRFNAIAAALLAALAALSVAALGWDIHAEFLARLLAEEGRSTTWQHNSSAYAWIENLRLLSDPRPETDSRPIRLTVMIGSMQVLILALFTWLGVRIGRRSWSSPATRRHAAFLLCLAFLLLVSPLIWTHYLALLFPLLVYLLATRRFMRPSARAILAGILLLSIGQNFLFVSWLQAQVRPDTWVEVFALGLFKSGPLLLTALLLALYPRDFLATYAAPAWRERSTEDQIASAPDVAPL